MDYQNLLINLLKNKDLISFKKYDEISRRLSNKDSRYLIENNLNIIKQYGGEFVTVIKKKNKYFFEIKNLENFKEKKELMKVKVGIGKLKGIKKLNIKNWMYEGKVEGLIYDKKSILIQSLGGDKIFKNKTFAEFYIYVRNKYGLKKANELVLKYRFDGNIYYNGKKGIRLKRKSSIRLKRKSSITGTFELPYENTTKYGEYIYLINNEIMNQDTNKFRVFF